MLISELEEKLKIIREEHGDLPVYLDREYGPSIEEVIACEKGYYNILGLLCHEQLAVWIS